MEVISWPIIIAIGVMSLIAFLDFGYDKCMAVNGWWRVSNMTLYVLILALGAPGALLGMIVCWHKVRKVQYWILVPIGLALDGYLIYLAIDWDSVENDITHLTGYVVSASNKTLIDVSNSAFANRTHKVVNGTKIFFEGAGSKLKDFDFNDAGKKIGNAALDIGNKTHGFLKDIFG